MGTLHKVSSQDVEVFIALYQDGLSFATIGKQFGVDPTTVHWWLEKRNIKRRAWQPRTHSFNEKFFDVVDTEAKAYWLGFLYADGYNYEKRGTVKISLQCRDESFLTRLKDQLGYKGEIKRHSTISKDKTRVLEYSTLYLHSKHMSRACVVAGFYQNKSLTLQFPTSDQVPDHLLHHFVRGYFDGDGCISFSRQNPRGSTFEITSSPHFIKSLSSRFIGMGFTPYIKLHTNGITKTVRLCRFKERVKLIHWLYRDATVFLGRKRDKCIDFVDYVMTKTRRCKDS